MIVDSTVWIDYFNGTRTPETDHLDEILDEEIVVVGDIILVEVLQGFRSDRDFERARKMLREFPQVRMLNPGLAVKSARNFRTLRRKGITIRKSIDCIIATYCIETHTPLLHADREFEPFEKYLGLKTV